MSTTTTYAVTMADIRAEPQQGNLWSGYGSPVQMSGRFNPQDGSQPAAAHLGRPRSRQAMDYPQYHHDRPPQDGGWL